MYLLVGIWTGIANADSAKRRKTNNITKISFHIVLQKGFPKCFLSNCADHCWWTVQTMDTAVIYIVMVKRLTL